MVNMPEILTLEIGGEKVDIISDQNLDFLFNNHDSFSNVIPGFSLVNRLLSNESTRSTLILNDGENVSYEKKSNTIVELTMPFQKISGQVITYAAYPLTEFIRQLNYKLTVHAASVTLDNNGIIIFGKEGAGKSTLAIELCRRENAKLIGNDLTIFGLDKNDVLNVFCGTKIFFLRKESVSRNLPDLLKFYPPSDLDQWRQKIYLKPSELQVEIATKPSPIKIALIVHIDESQNRLFVKDDSNDFTTKLILNENFTRYIRTTCIPGLDENGNFLYYMPSFDTTELYENRNKILNNLLTRNFLYISGRIKDIIDFIKSTIIEL